MILKSEVLNFATANLVCSVSLTGVMALQAARWWSERADTDEDDDDEDSEGLTQSRSTKKLKRGGEAARKLTAKASRHTDSRS